MDCLLTFFQRATGLSPRSPPATLKAAITALVFPGEHRWGGATSASQKTHKIPAEVMMKTTHSGESLKPQQKSSLGKGEESSGGLTTALWGGLSSLKVGQDLTTEITFPAAREAAIFPLPATGYPAWTTLLPWVGGEQKRQLSQGRLRKASTSKDTGPWPACLELGSQQIPKAKLGWTRSDLP